MKEALKQTAGIMDKIGFPVLLFVVAILFVLESKFELRKRVQNKWQRIKINVITGIPAFIMLRFMFIPVMVWLAAKNEHWHLGLLYLIPFSYWLKFAIGFIALDYFIYLWHRLTHAIPFLWRFHKVHHTDLDLDVSSAIRFHVGELLLSMLFRGGSVIIIGAAPILVLTYEIAFEVANNFHHSNLRLPLRLEKILNYLIITPRMHGTHHSIIENERSSNWGTIFSFWDRVHRTYSKLQRPETVIGLPEYQDKGKLFIKDLFLMPFKNSKDENSG